MATNCCLLKDGVVLQSLGPLDEALYCGVSHIWLTFVVACCGHRQRIFSSAAPLDSTRHLLLQLV